MGQRSVTHPWVVLAFKSGKNLDAMHLSQIRPKRFVMLEVVGLTQCCSVSVM